MAAGLEVELKLRAESDAPLDALASADRLGPASLGQPRALDEVDRYLDTAGGRLAAAGWACRLRDRGGTPLLSLKGPPQHGPAAAYHRRPELEGPAGSGLDPRAWPASAAGEELLRLSGGELLTVRLVLDQHRVERDVLLDGRRVAVLSLDRVRLRQSASEALRAVELELDPGGDPTGLDEVAVALQRQPGLVRDPLTKLEWALGLVADAGA